MRSLPFLLDRPMPSAVVEEVGDSNIVIEFGGWIDQDKTDFLKSRSAAINVVKSVLESDGFHFAGTDLQAPAGGHLNVRCSDRRDADGGAGSQGQ